jgi:hypothetical protein
MLARDRLACYLCPAPAAKARNNHEGRYMSYANCTVTVNNNGVSCNPDPVIVTRNSQDGVQWTMAQSGYTFTGVDIPGGGSDFGPPDITTNNAGRSVMTVTDSVQDLGDYSYTILYTTPSGERRSFDPTIRNNP